MTGSLAALLAGTAARRPGHRALIRGSAHLTYGRLWERARRYAAVLHASGVRPGDAVALVLADDEQFPLVYFGVQAAGAVAVPLNGTASVSEIAHVLTDADVRFLVCASSLRARAGAAAEGLGTRVSTVAELERAAAHTRPEDAFVARRGDDPAVVFYTSGTTGAPKGVVLTQRNILRNVTTMAVTPYAFRSDDVLLGGLPLAHGFGQICSMLTAFEAGITLVMMERFSGKEALALAAEHRCTVFMGVPTMYLKLLDAVADGGPVPRFDRVYSGGSPLPVPTFHDVRRVFQCPVYEGYGMTETSTSLTYNHPGVPCRPGTVGVPIDDGVTVGVARPNADSVELLPVGEVGEIVVRGETVMAGYLGRPDLTAEVIRDGWFHTGDLGTLDADGYLTVVGRKKELILRGGYNVYPREVEEVLAEHPAVAHVAVVGVPHPVLGEEVWAVVVPTRSQEATCDLAEEIVDWGRQRLSRHKCPRHVEFARTLPLGASGKVLKRELVSTLGPVAASRSATESGAAVFRATGETLGGPVGGVPGPG
ncbi:AMP-binding protein [Streptomyces reniochalinae]|uniref:Long-chain fatty acid--CoA ligase n=1 Tax=Streptomyces reniochalinae TaxID=2250578 RepID=A0A367EDL7_9ACTN|nr:AMP-binding protein [Streptomyces reniochalinae]RCG16164.1 long-chain fatty acid--CoA ligase [Streptomyces reniochalinae]